MKEFTGVIFIITIAIISFILLVYAFFAGVWEFNPTNISWFNTKLGITSLVIFIMSTALAKAIDEN